MGSMQTSSKRRQYIPRTISNGGNAKSSRRLSVVLLGFGAAVTLLVASWLGFLHKAEDSSLEIKDVEIAENGEIALTGARYQGITSSGQTFHIIANQANEAIDGSGHIDMQQPRASITMKNGDMTQIQSDYGVFYRANQQVDMAGSVIVLQPTKKLYLTSEALFADLELGEMRSLVPVTVTDDKRRIDAANMTVFDNGDRILFGGDVRMVMQPSQMSTSAN